MCLYMTEADLTEPLVASKASARVGKGEAGNTLRSLDSFGRGFGRECVFKELS